MGDNWLSKKEHRETNLILRGGRGGGGCRGLWCLHIGGC